MDIRKYRNYLFSFRGRIHREDFWSRFAITFAAFIIAAIAARYLQNTFIRYSLMTILIVAGFAVWLSSTVQRLHDRDKSAWYLFIFFGIPSVISNLESRQSEATDFSFLYFNTSFLGLFSGAIFIWMIVELGCLRGTAGPNRYGLDSLQPSPETPPAEQTSNP